MFIPQDNTEKIIEELHKNGIAVAAVIGRVTLENEDGMIRVITTQKNEYSQVSKEIRLLKISYSFNPAFI